MKQARVKHRMCLRAQSQVTVSFQSNVKALMRTAVEIKDTQENMGNMIPTLCNLLNDITRLSTVFRLG